MIYAYRLHAFATEELGEAYEWYENKQSGLGERFLRAVHKKIDEIALHPQTYSSRGKKDYREVKVEFFPYVIVYRVLTRKKEIYISAIHNTNKNPERKYRK